MNEVVNYVCCVESEVIFLDSWWNEKEEDKSRGLLCQHLNWGKVKVATTNQDSD